MISRPSSSGWRTPPGGGGSGSSGTCPTLELCRLYQQASWSIYPSSYEGFGFPILDSLRHGTPVLASGTSSMAEFDHPGVFFFDPQDPATVDLAWRRLQAARPVTIPQARLDELYSWDLVARAILDAHARSGEASRCRPASVLATGVRRGRSGQAGEPPRPRGPGAGAGGVRVASSRRPELRIGIEMFGTQTC